MQQMKQKRNWHIIIWGSILFLTVFLIVFFGISAIPNDTLKTFLTSLLSTVDTVILANVLWELLAKERFAKSLLDLVNISQNIANSGIETVFVNFLNIDWKREIKHTKNMTVVFTYAATWRESNRETLKGFSKKKHHVLNVIVPDCENEEIMEDFDRRFSFQQGETKHRIEECIIFFHNLHANIFLYQGTLHSSYYLLDNIAFMSFFRHSKEKGEVPALKIQKNGHMYSFVEKEIDEMIKNSTKVKSISRKLDDQQKWKTTIVREK